jgi:hypothetical protein
MDEGLLIVYLWDTGTSAARILDMANRVFILLQYRDMYTEYVNKCRTWFFSGGFVQDEPGIWHYVMQFHLRLFRTKELADVINRA